MKEYTLGSLLTISGQHEGAISRIVYYNGRTRKLEREMQGPLTMSIDGGRTLLEVLDDKRFQEVDIIGIVPRTSDPGLLEQLKDRLSDLLQWYIPDDEAVACAGGSPRGVGIKALIRE